MEMVNFFHMNGGTGDTSYSSNSGPQKMAILKTKGIIEKAICDIGYNTEDFPKTLIIADLGCSSGPNTLLVASILVNAVAKTSVKMGHKSPEIQINLNDLPTNDFNTIFSSLQEFKEYSMVEKIEDVHPSLSCYFTGVPGSFFGRLFPRKTLHFVHTSNSIQWLSQFPPEVGELNKGSIYISSTTPEIVTKMFYEQFQKDFMTFLRCRSEEMVIGGHMVLTLSGRKHDDPYDEEGYSIWKPFDMALEDMVSEGLIDEAKMDSFNIPQYTASLSEIKSLVEKQGSFKINHQEVFDVNWRDWKTKEYDRNEVSQFSEMEGHDVIHGMVMGMRAFIEALVANHFGEAIVEDIFMRYEKILRDGNHSKEDENIAMVTVSLINKM